MRLRITAIGICLLSLATVPASAQLLDQFKGAVGGGGGASSGGLLGGAMPSVDHASTGNIAGLVQFCIRNNYLSGGPASQVAGALQGKLPGRGTSDRSYQSGSQGLLDTGGGQHYNLAGPGNGVGGLKDQLTHKLCDQVLQRGRSLL